MATGPFVITEQSMSMRLGVSRDWLREHRGDIGVHWDRGAHNQVCYSESAFEALTALLEPRKDAPPSEPAPAAENVPCGQPEAVEPRKDDAGAHVLTVKWCRFPNRRVALCLDPRGQEVTLWVLDARRFAPGMRVLGIPRSGRPGVFDFAGNPENPDAGPRMPRRPGLW